MKWFISYAILIFIPLIIGGIIYLKTENFLESEIQRSNYYFSMLLQKEMDEVLSAQMRILTTLHYNSDLHTLSYMNKSDTQRYMITRRISDQLKTLSLINQYIDDQFLYIPNLDLAITPTGSTDGQTIYKMYFKNSFDNYEDWKSYIVQKNSGNTKILDINNYENVGKSVSFTNSLPLNDSNPTATAVIILYENSFLKKMTELSDVNNRNIFIIDGQNNVIIGSENFDKLKLSTDKLDSTKGILASKGGENNSDYVISYTTSNITNWKTVVATPKRIFWVNISNIRLLTFLSSILSLIVGGILCIFLVNRNYKPLKTLIKQIEHRQANSVHSAQNEYSYIMQSIVTTLKEKESIENQLEEQQTTITENLLYRLLKGLMHKQEIEQLSLETYHLNFSTDDKYIVTLFSPEDVNALFEEDAEMTLEERIYIQRFILTNVLEELLNCDYRCHTISIDHSTAILIALANDYHHDSNIITIISNGLEFIKEQFTLSYKVGISSVHHTLFELKDCYEEAHETMAYMNLFDIGGIFVYENIPKKNSQNIYAIEQDIQLKNCIKSGDAQTAKVIIEEILSKTFQQNQDSIEYVRYIVFTLVVTILNMVKSDRNDIFSSEMLKNIFYFNSLQQIKNDLFKITEAICDSYRDRLNNTQILLSDQIIDFVEKNYHNQNFNIADIGNHFSLTAPYISKLFKKETGQSIFDYINKVRIEHAKNQIISTDKSFEQIAHDVGYLDSRALGRAFKRSVGILPSKYKELSRKQI